MNQTEGLADLLRAVMAVEPQSGAIEFRQGWTSWGEMARVVAQIDDLLRAAGHGEGLAVGMLLRNGPSQLCGALAVLLSRRCVLTINSFQPPQALAANLEQLRAAVLVMDEQDWARPEVQAAAQGAMVILLQDREGRVMVRLARGCERTTAAERHAAMPGVAVLMLSSGTTGTPKRVPLAFESLEKAILGAAFYENGSSSGEGLKIKRSVAFLSMPLVHIGGLWMALLNLVAGRPLVLFEKFAVEPYIDAVRRHRPKLVSLPPAALRMIYDANLPKEDLSSLIAIRGGSAPLDPAFADDFQARYGVPILDAYGATEFAGGVAGWTWPQYQEWGKRKRGSVGKANQGVKIRVVDRETAEVLPAGQVGMLEVQAPQISGSGWMRTTDLAELDADGFLYIRGRSDDAIIRGGFKVFPTAVADVLRQHPALFDACVVGLPDARLGAVPMAAVEVRPGHEAPSERELLDFLRSQLVAYQVPVRVAVLAELPRTPSMKVSQPGVKALLQDLQGTNRAAA